MPAKPFGGIDQAEFNQAFHTWMQRIQEASQDDKTTSDDK
jgi:hypothetical protein